MKLFKKRKFCASGSTRIALSVSEYEKDFLSPVRTYKREQTSIRSEPCEHPLRYELGGETVQCHRLSATTVHGQEMSAVVGLCSTGIAGLTIAIETGPGVVYLARLL